MYRKIVIPVDLAHKDALSRGIEVAVDLAKHYGATLTLIGVTSSPPGDVAKNPADYEAKLSEFASEIGADSGVNVHSRTVVVVDPTVEVDKGIAEAAEELDADLVVMSSHKPGLLEYVFPSHAGHFAAHTDLSVFIVR